MISKTFKLILIVMFSTLLLATTCKDDNVEPDNTSGTFTDSRDGRNYNWQKIGDQVWMTENLAYYTENSWAYNNETANVDQYGLLYTWEAAQVAVPDGWHIASDNEWKELQMFIGLTETEANEEGWHGNKAKKLQSNVGWNDNGGGTDEYGFKAMGGGYYLGGGSFDLMGESGIWWTSTEATDFNTSYAWLRQMSTNNDAINRGRNDKGYGYSVRCVRD